MTFKKYRKQKIWSYFSTMALPYSQSISEETRQRLLNLGSNIKENILWYVLFIFL
jgi:hypothetical protein